MKNKDNIKRKKINHMNFVEIVENKIKILFIFTFVIYISYIVSRKTYRTEYFQYFFA